jgi:hypothetical protein
VSWDDNGIERVNIETKPYGNHTHNHDVQSKSSAGDVVHNWANKYKIRKTMALIK